LHFLEGFLPMRILIAEDDPALGSLLARMFQEQEYTVTWVRDGAAAIEAWGQAQYGLLVLDLNLPKIDGIDVLRVAREQSEAAVLVLIQILSLTQMMVVLPH